MGTTAPEFIGVADKAALTDAAAQRIAVRLADASEGAAVCLTGGSTVQTVYERLASGPWRRDIPVDRLHWFVGDERVVPFDHPWSNAGAAWRALLAPLGVAADHVHWVDTRDGDPHAAALRYERELMRFYGQERLDPNRALFVLVLLGMGADGHTASLFPGSPALNEQHHWVVGVDDAGQPPRVTRVTLTFPALASTDTMLFMVSGEEKRAALGRLLAGDDIPAARARSAGSLTWLVDDAAMPGGFPVKTPVPPRKDDV